MVFSRSTTTFLFIFKFKYRRKCSNRRNSSGTSHTSLSTSEPSSSRSNNLPSLLMSLMLLLIPLLRTRRRHPSSVSLSSPSAAFLLTTLLIFQSQLLHVGRAVKCGGSTSSSSGRNSSRVGASQLPVDCINGACVGDKCVCHPGFAGPSCQHCFGKVKVDAGQRGWISDGAGNYTANMKCTWLLQAPSSSVSVNNNNSLAPLFLRIEEFATECGWDWLYIYDGDSVFSPLVGVFSGIVVQNSYQVLRLPEIVAKSGYALLHFYTDVAYNLTGFNITYRSQSCPSNNSLVACSGNGVCVEGVCTCDAPYKGMACNLEKCPNNCSNNGVCDMEKHRCRCNDGFKGNDCRYEEKESYWQIVHPNNNLPHHHNNNNSLPPGSASHASVIYNNSMWVFGGSTLGNGDGESISIFRFDFNVNKWEAVLAKSSQNPPSLYGHSCVVYEGKVYLYGGVQNRKYGSREVSKSVWTFDLSQRKWSKQNVRPDKCKRGMCGPLRVVGHSAVIITDKGNKSRHSHMVVISGHSPRYGYVNVVQEYHFGSGNWNIVTTKGHPFMGSFGHSSNWDPVTQKIYVYGGYQLSHDSSSAALSNSLFSYDPSSHTWHFLEEGPHGKFLHGGAVHRGLYFILGGNGHNDTTYSLGSKCFTNEVLVYDLMCDSWTTLQPPSSEIVAADVSRYGHSVVVYQDSIIMYGGFNGVLQRDIIQFNPTSCTLFTNRKECLSSIKSGGAKCLWNSVKDVCEAYGSHGHWKDTEKDNDVNPYGCSGSGRFLQGRKLEENCLSFHSCSSCLQSKIDCVWCGGYCQYAKCKDSRPKVVTASDNCKEDDSQCKLFLHNCPLCTTEVGCAWGKEDRCIVDSGHRNNNEGTTSSVGDRDTGTTCDQSCSDLLTCSNCTSSNCMWCNNLHACVDKNAYVVSFPYGECMSWSQLSSSCYSKDSQFVPSSGSGGAGAGDRTSMCDEVLSCETCLSLPSCGWCDDGSGTGKGSCMDGSSRGPIFVNATGARAYLIPDKCPSPKWHFTTCPACQCNGHSTCDENDRCEQCQDYTEGDHCERCVQGFYGRAINGGHCAPCECNGQADFCHTETGRCFCTTKGITGEDCKRCDTQNNYSGDPNNSSCYYELQIDYQFTFNLSKKEDQYYTKINFRNTPNKPDIDADFQVTCSMPARLNISVVRAGLLPEVFIVENQTCTTYKRKFGKSDYMFGPPENTTFFVYVYDFHPPLWIQISFSQSPKLDLLHFFITFSTCFLVLLVLAAVMWKIKQRYDMYRRRQRLFVEMEQMASRPFAQVYLEVSRVNPLSRLSSLRRRKKDAPSPIALEPLQGNRAAILSLLISLPTGSQQFAPPGQSGLSVGSTLVSLGNPRKVSFDPVSSKTEGKSKIRKSLPSHGLNTCI